MDVKTEQRLLSLVGEYRGGWDGVAGPKTLAARDAVWNRFSIQSEDDYFTCLEQVAIELVSSAKGEGEAQVKRLVARRAALVGLGMPEQVAYLWATLAHETAHTWQPVREGLNASDSWRARHLRYYPWYGRGYVQLTWERNYRKYQDLTGVPLTKDPDLAMEPGLSAFILVHGARTGAFTGKALADYIRPGTAPRWVSARRVINGFFPGMVRAKTIALAAQGYVKEAREVLEELGGV